MLLVMMAQRYGVAPQVYYLTRTPKDLAQDVRAWLGSIATPAAMVFGRGKGGGGPGGARRPPAGRRDLGRYNFMHGARKPLSRNVNLVRLPPPDQRLPALEREAARRMVAVGANSLTRIGKKRGKASQFSLPARPPGQLPG